MSRMEKILNRHCEAHGVPVDQVKTWDRRSHIVAARWAFIADAHAHHGKTKMQIARFLGITWPSVHHAIQKTQQGAA